MATPEYTIVFHVHPLSEVFPAMPDADFAALRDSIARNGLRHPIVLFEERILDGRHRYRACIETEVEPTFTTFEGGYEDAIEFVRDQNVTRRQLTKSQLAMSAAMLVTANVGGRRHGFTDPRNYRNEVTAGKAATLFGINVETVQKAREIRDYGNEDMIVAVHSGKISVADAWSQMRRAKREAAARAEAERRAEESAARAEAEREAAEQARLAAKRRAEESAARAEAERQAAEKARQEAERRAEQARRQAESAARAEAERRAEEEARAEAERQAAEQARLEAERRAEQARRKAEEEAERKAEEEARAESERKAAEVKLSAGISEVVNGHSNTLTAAVNMLTRKELGENPPPLPEGIYRTIVIDPPWPMTKIKREVRPNQHELDYPTISVDEIGAMPVGDMLADVAFVFLWTTQKFLPDSFAILNRWGLKYRFTMVWHKPGGIQPINSPQFNGEFVVAGSIGNPLFTDLKAFNAVFTAPRGRHSEKPEAFYDLLRRVCAEPRLDMFNRRAIRGFDAWGNEANGQSGLFERAGEPVGAGAEAARLL